MTDIDQNMDETIDIDDKHLEAIDKQEEVAGCTFGGDKESTQQSQAHEETEESVDGFSSDFGNEEAKGLRCMPSSASLHHCLMGKATPLPEEQPE